MASRGDVLGLVCWRPGSVLEIEVLEAGETEIVGRGQGVAGGRRHPADETLADLDAGAWLADKAIVLKIYPINLLPHVRPVPVFLLIIISRARIPGLAFKIPKKPISSTGLSLFYFISSNTYIFNYIEWHIHDHHRRQPPSRLKREYTAAPTPPRVPIPIAA
jgi:hypothetical protein